MKLSKTIESLAEVGVIDFNGDVFSKELCGHIQEAWAQLDEAQAALAGAGF